MLILSSEAHGNGRLIGMIEGTLMSQRIVIHLFCEFIMLGILYLFYVKKSRICAVLTGVTGVLHTTYWLWYFGEYSLYIEDVLPFLPNIVLTAVVVFFTFHCHKGLGSSPQPPVKTGTTA